ncbi:MAG: gst7 [Parcubacteria group bacterium]|nr:gst7 [Parcubacteria group bacterium]
MLKLYTWKTPNGFKVPILLEELGIEYELIPIDISKGEQKTPEYLVLNLNSKIPTLVDEDAQGGPLTIFESGAILEYLAEKSGKFLPKDAREKYEVMEWLMFQMAGVGPMLGQLAHFVRFAPEKIPYAIDRYTNEAKRLFAVLDVKLAKGDYLANEYSIADMATWPWIRAAKTMDIIDFGEYPNVSRWFDEMDSRPAVKAAIKKTEAVCV